MRFTYLLFLVFLFSRAPAQYFPSPTEWQQRTAAEAGFTDAGLDSVVQFAINNEYSGQRDLRLAILEGFSREPGHTLRGPTKERGEPAGMIIKDGYLVTSWGYTDRVDMTFSVTKSYLSTTAGLALDDGLIHSVDDLVSEYVWDGTFDGQHNGQITWEHLLQQTSDWSGTLFGLEDWTDRPDPDGTYDSWKNRELHVPGTHFKYNDVRVNVLAYSLLQVWRLPLPQVLKERIMDPIGASTTWRWHGYDDSWVELDGLRMQSVSGGGHHGGGLFISTEDHARLGLLFARRGNWNGEQLISERWVDMIRTPAAANASYGYMWWLNAGDRAWEGVPDHVYYAAGFGGNFIVVDEELDLVVVTRWLEPSEIGPFMRRVYAAL
ncbi:CubicO group peptidase (beta-lactamase class C family) [Neolewinella xylanilytica]|uniref:CubicO group peptidase (Beta-lactamase class C family) n=1 Tax=Neolewinella xylanilytica TaxID=1514080 RepID=A0A2S6I9G7_9BACT|nr:serine hydrolase [Neolewinella xylanilytica]PPK88147.1 CubicO group peptidase (beta-lactamase class C family) [Neolewinella xylanilytica]